METITYYKATNLLLVTQLILYAIGSYIQIKVISTCRKEKDKVWQITITNSITMMIVFSFVMIFQTVSSHVPVMSQYTGLRLRRSSHGWRTMLTGPLGTPTRQNI